MDSQTKKIFDINSLKFALPSEVRSLIREKKFQGPTCGIANAYLQANVVIVEEHAAKDFEKFCQLNPKPAPLLEMLQPGNPYTQIIANNSDVRTDIPKYRIHYSDGSFKDVDNIKNDWKKNFVTFFLGCSFSFEDKLQKNDIPCRHIELNCNVPMYNTNIPVQSVNGFGNNLVVSMRPIPINKISLTYKITYPFLKAHGEPVFYGNPNDIGIQNINKPDYGDPVPIYNNEIPVFWACGVTALVAIKNALKIGKIRQAITHSPGYMFISDVKAEHVNQNKCLL